MNDYTYTYTVPNYGGANATFEQDWAAYVAANPGTNPQNGQSALWEKNNSVYKYLTMGTPTTSSWRLAYEPIVPSQANTFRTTLNNNFTAMGVQADATFQNMERVRTTLSDLAYSGSAEYVALADGATKRRFTTDTEKAHWNSRTWIDPTSGDIKVWQDNTDVTQAMKNLITASIPTMTGQLTDTGAQYIPGTEMQAPGVYAANVQTGSYTTDSTFADFPRKWTVTLAGCTASMMPCVIFDQATAISGDWAQVCESGDDEVYIWSKDNVDSIVIKQIYAINANQV